MNADIAMQGRFADGGDGGVAFGLEVNMTGHGGDGGACDHCGLTGLFLFFFLLPPADDAVC